jgi:hypothetical protein
MDIQVQEAYRNLEAQNEKIISLYYIIVKMSRVWNKDRILKDVKSSANLLTKAN